MKHHRLFPFLAALLLCALAACTADRLPEPAAEPDQAHDRIVQALADGRPQIVWDALPESYQQDVEGVIHQAAAVADREIWTRAFEVLQKLTRVLREKKQFILDNAFIAAQIGNDANASKGWDAIVGAFDALAASELSNPARVETLDVRAFLEGTGSRVMRQLLEAGEHAPQDLIGGRADKLRATTATILSREGDGATLRIETPGEPPSEERWIRVEGKWIPEEWTEDWQSRLDEVRGGLSRMAEGMDAGDRQQALLRLTMVEGVLDQLLAAETPEEFNATLGTALGVVLGAFG